MFFLPCLRARAPSLSALESQFLRTAAVQVLGLRASAVRVMSGRGAWRRALLDVLVRRCPFRPAWRVPSGGLVLRLSMKGSRPAHHKQRRQTTHTTAPYNLGGQTDASPKQSTASTNMLRLGAIIQRGEHQKPGCAWRGAGDVAVSVRHDGSGIGTPAPDLHPKELGGPEHGAKRPLPSLVPPARCRSGRV